MGRKGVVHTLLPLNCIVTLCICMNVLEVGAAVLSRFSCTEFGKSTQTCKMKCNYDGSCSESLQIVSCNCDGYGVETFDKNYYKNGNEVNYIIERSLPYSPYVRKRGFDGRTTACNNLPSRCSSCNGGERSGGSATKWQTEFCNSYENDFGRVR